MNDHLDDSFGYRRNLIEAAKNDLSCFVVMNYISCIMNQVHISSELKEVVYKHLDNAYKFSQMRMNDYIDDVQNFRNRFEHLQFHGNEKYLVERILEMRCEIAVIQSLYGERVRQKVELIDDELKFISDLSQFVKDSAFIHVLRRAMQNIGIDPWWIELPLA